MKKKWLGIILPLSLTISMMAACGPANQEDVPIETEAVQLKAVSAQRLEEAENADVASVSFDLLCQSDAAQVEAMLDAGTTLIVNHVSQEEISALADQFSLDFYPAENNALQRTYAAVLRKSLTGEIQIIEYIAEIAKECGIFKTIEPPEEDVEKTLAWVSEHEELEMKGTEAALQVLEQNSRRTAETLHGSASVQDSFAHVSKHYDLYMPMTEPEDTTSDAAKGSEYKLASVDLALLLLKEKTEGNATIDAAVAECQVKGYAPNQTKIKAYQVKLGTPSRAQYVLDPTRLNSDLSQTVSVTLSVSGTGITGGIDRSYTYKSGGQEIINHFSEQYEKWWEVTPIDPESGDVYHLSPSMVVEKKDGKTAAGTVKATFSSIKVNNGPFSNWVSDVDKVISIKFKNHQKQ